MVIEVPPLRQQRDQIPVLLQRIFQDLSARLPRNIEPTMFHKL